MTRGCDHCDHPGHRPVTRVLTLQVEVVTEVVMGCDSGACRRDGDNDLSRPPSQPLCPHMWVGQRSDKVYRAAGRSVGQVGQRSANVGQTIKEWRSFVRPLSDLDLRFGRPCPTSRHTGLPRYAPCPDPAGPCQECRSESRRPCRNPARLGQGRAVTLPDSGRVLAGCDLQRCRVGAGSWQGAYHRKLGGRGVGHDPVCPRTDWPPR